MKLKFLEGVATVILVAAFVPGVFSQTATAPPPPPGQRVLAFDSFAFDEPIEVHGGKVITGLPFSGEISTEMIQTLADGNTIQHKSTGLVARDSQGRVRREMVLPRLGPLAVAGEEPRIVVITDPVAGKRYFLDENRKIAREVSLRAESGGGIKFEGQIGMKFDTKRLPAGTDLQISTESLGRQTMEGLVVEGTRITRTIPAQAIGNTNPIISTTERWYAPDVQITVMVKRSDPRFGNSTSQLTNISREEPPVSLFTVPADYTIKKSGDHDHLAFPVKPDQD